MNEEEWLVGKEEALNERVGCFHSLAKLGLLWARLLEGSKQRRKKHERVGEQAERTVGSWLFLVGMKRKMEQIVGELKRGGDELGELGEEW